MDRRDPGLLFAKVPSGLRFAPEAPYFETRLTFTGPIRENGEVSCHCPFHEDMSPSLSLNVAKNAWICFSCDRRGDALTMEEYLTGSYGAAMENVERAIRENEHPLVFEGAFIPPRPGYRPHEGDLEPAELPGPDTIEKWRTQLLQNPLLMERLQREKGLTEESIRAFGLGWSGYRIMIPIRDESGNLRNVRQYDLLKDRPGAPKMLNWRGHGEAVLWAPEKATYSSPRLLLTAGEWDSMLMTQMGYPAITSTGGEKSYRPEWGEFLKGRGITICYDRDRAGQDGMFKIAKHLRPIARVHTVVIPGEVTEDHGVDLSDWVLSGKDVSELLGDLPPAASILSVREVVKPEDPPEEEADTPRDSFEALMDQLTFLATPTPGTPVPIAEADVVQDGASDVTEDTLEDQIRGLSVAEVDPSYTLKLTLRTLLKLKKKGKKDEVWTEFQIKRIAKELKPKIPMGTIRAELKELAKEELKGLRPTFLLAPNQASPLVSLTISFDQTMQELKYLIYLPANETGIPFAGVVENWEPYFVSSTRRELVPCKPGEREKLPLPAELLPGWSCVAGSPYGIAHYTSGGSAPPPHLVFESVRAFIQRFMWLPESWEYDFLALWTMYTYHYSIHSWAPYLWISGTMESAKTQLLDILSQIAFSGTLMGNASAATLFRVTGSKGGVLFLDEADSVRKGADSDVLLEILRTGNHKNGTVTRTQKQEDGNYGTVQFSTFGPKVLANVTGVESALRTRMVEIPTRTKEASIVREPWGESSCEYDLTVLRNMLYCYGLSTAEYISSLNLQIRQLALADIPNRSLDNWLPILCEAHLISEELYEQMIEVAKSQKQEESKEIVESDPNTILLQIFLTFRDRGNTIKHGSHLLFPISEIREVFQEQTGVRIYQLTPFAKRLGIIPKTGPSTMLVKRGGEAIRCIVVRGDALTKAASLRNTKPDEILDMD